MASKASIPKFAKLSPPRLPKVVERPRLYRQLDTLRKHHSLIWIAAPPGMGKTTLASSYLNVRKLKSVWFQADEADRDPATLFHFLGLAHQQYAPRSRVRLPHFTLEYLKNLPFFSRTFFQQFYSRLKPQTVVVWDNFQELGWGNEIPDWFLDGWLQVPEDVTLIVLSREDAPSGFARVQANQQVGMIHTDELKLSPIEVQALVTLQQVESTERGKLVVPQVLLDQLQGWPAGLLLVIEQLKQGEIVEAPKEKVFDYWSQEVLTQFSQAMQQALCKLSILPSMTTKMAIELTGQDEVGTWLAELARRRYFTERRNDHEPVYQFHALFREFLHGQALLQYSQQDWAADQMKAAQLLEGQGNIVEARDLFVKVGQQDEVCRIILTQAPQMAEQGRTELLLSWIEKLPDPFHAQSAWIILWRGMCHFGIDMDSAKSDFRQAFEKFKTLKDELGMVLAWSGLVDTIVWSWGDLDKLLKYIEEFEMNFPHGYESPKLEVEFRLTSAMLGAYMWKRLDHPDMAYWEKRAANLLSQVMNETQLVILGNMLSMYYFWTSQHEKQAVLVDEVCRRTSNSLLSPVSKLMLETMECVFGFMRMDGKNILVSSNAMEILIRENGGDPISFPQIFSGQVIGNLLLGNIQQADEILKKYEEFFKVAPVLCLGYYHHNKGYVEAHQYRYEQAIQSFALALKSSYDTAVNFPIVINHLCLAFLEAECSRFHLAQEHIENGLQVAQLIKAEGLEGVAYLAKAFVNMKKCDSQATTKTLRYALGFLHKVGVSPLHWVVSRFITMLCTRALQEGIEVGFVQSVIRNGRLQPEEPLLDVPAWPWPVRVRTLGTFEIEVNDQLVQFGRKVPRRVLALLQALIAFGGENVREDQLLDALWPEADGDRAYRSYATALHRLRKILGDEKAIIVKDSKVTLDPYLCWVDVWAFDHLLEQATKAEQEGDVITSHQLCEQALQFYHGPFLADDEFAEWATRMRERLRKKYVTHVEKLCRVWSKDEKEVQEARKLFARAMELEPELDSFSSRACSRNE